MIDFTIPEDVAAVVERLQRFIDDEVVPVESGLTDEDYRGEPSRVEAGILPGLRDKARAAGVYAPHVGKRFGGMGLGPTALAFLSERCGPHPLASLAINMMAPDEATMHLLETFGSPEQQERWLRPLVDGRIRSCFGMTEPDAGSDPRRIAATATPADGGWVINATKVFTTGAIGAAFCVVMASSDPRAEAGRGISMFLVPTDTPGFQVVRDLETMGYHGLGGHPEIRLTDVLVPADAQLGELGAGFAMAQARLAQGRIGHAMRWIGIAQRALDMGASRALGREVFGDKLSERQAVQWWLADGATQLRASRLLVLHALWLMEQGLPCRTEVAMVKTYVAEMLGKVVDEALQIHGGWGYTTEFPLERWYRDARAARIYDGPSEVHRMFVARQLLRQVTETGTSAGVAGDLLASARPAPAKERRA